MATERKHTDAGKAGYEKTDAKFKQVMLTGFGLLGVMVMGLLFAWGVKAILIDTTQRPGAIAETFTMPADQRQLPEPRLQADPAIARVALQASVDSVLGSYGWSNKEVGVARVPIERAMEMLTQRGLPVLSSGDGVAR